MPCTAGLTDLEGFWSSVWEFFDVEADTTYERVLSSQTMPGARWFEGATLNYAHHALRRLGEDTPAIVALDESGSAYEVTGGRLRAQVASVAATLRDLGVGRGDRVVGYLPNTPHAIVAFLAAASLGAVWSVCGQDYAPQAAADRFAQLDPTVLVTTDGYRFNGTTHDRRDAALELGGAKILASAPMRDLAAEAGFSVGACRVIGVLKVAGAAGVALSWAVPLFGALAGTGLLLLMAGAVITHGRKGDGLRGMAPALACAVLVACYLAALIAM